MNTLLTGLVAKQVVDKELNKHVSLLMNEHWTLEHLSFSSVATKALPPPSTKTLALRLPGGSLIDGPLSSYWICGAHCKYSLDGNFPLSWLTPLMMGSGGSSLSTLRLGVEMDRGTLPSSSWSPFSPAKRTSSLNATGRPMSSSLFCWSLFMCSLAKLVFWLWCCDGSTSSYVDNVKAGGCYWNGERSCVFCIGGVPCHCRLRSLGWL